MLYIFFLALEEESIYAMTNEKSPPRLAAFYRRIPACFRSLEFSGATLEES
jgi:hypothetical protein